MVLSVFDNRYLWLIGSFLLALALAALSPFYWNWRLRRWASAEGLTLIGYRTARSCEGPGGFWRSENERLFHADVTDARGNRRSAWVLFGSRWGLTPGEPLTRVHWD